LRQSSWGPNAEGKGAGLTGLCKKTGIILQEAKVGKDLVQRESHEKRKEKRSESEKESLFGVWERWALRPLFILGW
jgi:hypothetical protein